MHICFITHEYPKKGLLQGGIGSVVQTIGRALVQKGIKVSVVGVGNFDDSKENDEGVSVYRVKSSSWKFGKFYQNKNKLLKKIEEIHSIESIDIVEGSELNFAFFPKKYFAKKVIRLHGGHRYFAESMGRYPSFWRSYQESKSFDKADALIAVSNYVGSKTKELVGFEQDFKTIYNLVDTNKFFEADCSKVIPNKIVFVGTVTEKKGVRQLVQAMSLIVKKYPNVSLDIIGRDWIDPVTKISYTEFLKSVISNDVKRKINIVGPLPHNEIPERLESADICCYPSHMEAMPIAWLEALGMGKKVVASLLGPGPEAVKNNETGILCNPLKPEDIAEKIIYVLDNPEKSKEMGLNARKDILARFNPKKILQENIDFYKSLV